MSQSSLVAILTDPLRLLGATTALVLVYNFCYFWLPYVTPSKLHRYHHGKPGSTWALITGASDGIGYGFACSLLDSGFNILLHGRNETKLQGIQQELAKQYPALEIRYVVADASATGASHEHIVAAARNLPGKLTILINNVGGATNEPTYGALSELSESLVDKVINLNARWPTQLTRALLPTLTENKPSVILNVGSFTGVFGMAYLSIYCPSKAFNLRFTESLRQEMVGKDVEVLGILVANVASAGNKQHMAGFTCTSRTMADTSLARIGCGRALVSGWYRHGLQAAMMSLIPQSVMEAQMTKMMLVRKTDHEKQK